MAWLVSNGSFGPVQDGNDPVGHAHNKVDQRISVVANVLARQTLLQTLEDFLTVIQQHMRPVGRRELDAKQLEAEWGRQELCAPAQIVLFGSVASRATPYVRRPERFVGRQDAPFLSLALPADDYNLRVPAICGKDMEQADDEIMLVKEFWSSASLAPPPPPAYCLAQLLLN